MKVMMEMWKKEMRAKTRRKKRAWGWIKAQLSLGTVSAAVFAEWMFLLFARKRPCQRSQNLSQQALSSLYSSPSPVPAHLKSICRSMPLCNLLRHRIPAAGSLTWRQCHTKIYPKAVIGRSPSGLGVGGLGSTLSLSVLLPPNRNFFFMAKFPRSWVPPFTPPNPPKLTPVVFIILLQLG